MSTDAGTKPERQQELEDALSLAEAHWHDAVNASSRAQKAAREAGEAHHRAQLALLEYLKVRLETER